ncbi:MAG: hypothetical protein OFPI_29950 [Osedax symbiont Rs2]|nr:MAG: hypothetical protein OFPI_29950 [Osedax symbiont Rs2]
MITSENISDKRSLLYRCYQQQPAALTAEIDVAQLSLHDFSVKLRYGFRGPQARTVLSSAKIALPSAANSLCATVNGELVLRLSNSEYWLLHPQVSGQQALLDSQSSEQCYSLFCQDSHAWLVLAGPNIARVMAKLCAVDLRENAFPLGAVAQTSVARVNAIIAHHRLADSAVFSILSDSASASYLWDAIQDAMQEFKG